MSIKDGGPFHPFQPLDRQGMPCMAAEPGLSIRDHFAGLAMQAIIIANREEIGRAIVCDSAYLYADEMLRTREASQ